MYRQGWGWLAWAVLAYVLLALGPRVCDAATLQWVRSPSGVWQAFDPNTGALLNGGPGTFGEAQTIFRNGSLDSSGGFEFLQGMGPMTVSDSSLGQLAVTGVEVGASIGSDGILPLAGEVIGDLWGLSSLAQLLQDLGAPQVTQNPSMSLPPGACSGGGESLVGYIAVYSSTGVLSGYIAECQYSLNGDTSNFCEGDNGGGWVGDFTCPSNPPTTPSQAIQDYNKAIDAGGSAAAQALRDLQKIISVYPPNVATPAVQPGSITDHYTGPQSQTYPPVTTSPSTSTSSSPSTSTSSSPATTVTPSVTLSYGPGGVSPTVKNMTCVGTASCSTTTASSPPVPFEPPNGLKFPPNPSLSPTAVPLSLNPQTVSGTCPPPVELNLSAEDMGSYSISLEPFCTLASYVQPVIVATTAVVAGFIIFR